MGILMDVCLHIFKTRRMKIIISHLFVSHVPLNISYEVLLRSIFIVTCLPKSCTPLKACSHLLVTQVISYQNAIFVQT